MILIIHTCKNKNIISTDKLEDIWSRGYEYDVVASILKLLKKFPINQDKSHIMIIIMVGSRDYEKIVRHGVEITMNFVFIHTRDRFVMGHDLGQAGDQA